jgi:hypothetical protein
MTRLYGRAPRGERVVGKVPQAHGQTTTVVGAIRHDGVSAALAFEGGHRRGRLPDLRRGRVGAGAAAGGHRGAGPPGGASPPYSPDYTRSRRSGRRSRRCCARQRRGRRRGYGRRSGRRCEPSPPRIVSIRSPIAVTPLHPCAKRSSGPLQLGCWVGRPSLAVRTAREGRPTQHLTCNGPLASCYK